MYVEIMYIIQERLFGDCLLLVLMSCFVDSVYAYYVNLTCDFHHPGYSAMIKLCEKVTAACAPSKGHG